MITTEQIQESFERNRTSMIIIGGCIGFLPWFALVLGFMYNPDNFKHNDLGDAIQICGVSILLFDFLIMLPIVAIAGEEHFGVTFGIGFIIFLTACILMGMGAHG